jgi:transcriptional regulator with XRE-family HTH domain
MKKPKSVDIVVGKRVRLRRVAIKMSQQELAKALRITFQQVQ